MLKYTLTFLALVAVGIVLVAGFRGQKFKTPPIEIFPDMDHQPKYKAQIPSPFFADNRGNRKPVAGTVPLGFAMPQSDDSEAGYNEMSGPYKQIQFTGSPNYYNTGRMGENWGDGIPFEITREVLDRGQQRYNISCAVCHGATGAGNGITSKYGLVGIADLGQQRLREMSDGEIYNTITHGKNTMMGYGANIQVPDRWAIVAYVRALQSAQSTPINELPPEVRTQIEQTLSAQ